jgi:hypothetical protein
MRNESGEEQQSQRTAIACSLQSERPSRGDCTQTLCLLSIRSVTSLITCHLHHPRSLRLCISPCSSCSPLQNTESRSRCSPVVAPMRTFISVQPLKIQTGSFDSIQFVSSICTARSSLRTQVGSRHMACNFPTSSLSASQRVKASNVTPFLSSSSILPGQLYSPNFGRISGHVAFLVYYHTP